MEVFTVRTKTVMERSHIPLHKWIYGMYLLVTARKDISSMQLAKEIGIRQGSAWFMLQRLRESCKGTSGLLSCIVEIDKTYIGGKEKNKHANKRLKAGLWPVGKRAVFWMRERGGDVVAIAVAGNHKTQVQGPICRNIKAGLILHTEHKAYYGLLDRLYGHEMVNHSAEEWVHTAMYIPTGSRACGPRYVDEFAFRLNEGACQRHTMDRIESMIASTVGKRITYEALTE